MEDIEERLDDEEIEVDPADAAGPDDEAEPTPGNGDAEVESIEEVLVQKGETEEDEGDEDETILAAPRDERVETLATKVVPLQATEFVCASCHLVKHRSQLADKNRRLCRDCA